MRRKPGTATNFRLGLPEIRWLYQVLPHRMSAPLVCPPKDGYAPARCASTISPTILGRSYSIFQFGKSR
jgi:hypothetical protein